jgi:hypothetical protein
MRQRAMLLLCAYLGVTAVVAGWLAVVATG